VGGNVLKGPLWLFVALFLIKTNIYNSEKCLKQKGEIDTEPESKEGENSDSAGPSGTRE
jgi:hypothetical protein